MISPDKAEYSKFKSRLEEEYSGKREITICGKVSSLLNAKVRATIDGDKYVTLNDLVEEAILEKIIRIEWDKAKSVGE